MSKMLLNLLNFKAGELTEYLYIRTDLDYYSSAAKQIKNLIVWQHGGVTRRAGTKIIHNITTSPTE